METKSVKIVDVYFSFNGSSVISTALDMTGIYRPSVTAERIKSNYVLNLPNAEKDQSLVITMSTENGKDEIAFLAYDRPSDDEMFTVIDSDSENKVPEIEYDEQGSEPEKSDFESKVRAQFTLPLSKVLGPKGWAAYLRGKTRPGADVITPADAEESWREQENLHNHLADRLKKALETHGLRDIHDLEDNDIERKLIGIFLDYREMAQNPQRMLRRLGM